MAIVNHHTVSAGVRNHSPAQAAHAANFKRSPETRL
jgi:hypothetical protein